MRRKYGVCAATYANSMKEINDYVNQPQSFWESIRDWHNTQHGILDDAYDEYGRPRLEGLIPSSHPNGQRGRGQYP